MGTTAPEDLLLAGGRMTKEDMDEAVSSEELAKSIVVPSEIKFDDPLSLVNAARAVVERDEGDRIGTHYEGCYLTGGPMHHGCLILRLADALEEWVGIAEKRKS